MSRVHDALRRAELAGYKPDGPPPDEEPRPQEVLPASVGSGGSNGTSYSGANQSGASSMNGALVNGQGGGPVRLNLHPAMLAEVAVMPFSPAPESHLLDLNNSHETPG